MLELTDAAWPLVDAFTTTASLFATWMVAQRVLENWLYWLIIDAISIASSSTVVCISLPYSLGCIS